MPTATSFRRSRTVSKDTLVDKISGKTWSIYSSTHLSNFKLTKKSLQKYAELIKIEMTWVTLASDDELIIELNVLNYKDSNIMQAIEIIVKMSSGNQQEMKIKCCCIISFSNKDKAEHSYTSQPILFIRGVKKLRESVLSTLQKLFISTTTQVILSEIDLIHITWILLKNQFVDVESQVELHYSTLMSQENIVCFKIDAIHLQKLIKSLGRNCTRQSKLLMMFFFHMTNQFFLGANMKPRSFQLLEVVLQTLKARTDGAITFKSKQVVFPILQFLNR